MARTFIIQLLMLSLLLRSTSLWVALLVLGKQEVLVENDFETQVFMLKSYSVHGNGFNDGVDYELTLVCLLSGSEKNSTPGQKDLNIIGKMPKKF